MKLDEILDNYTTAALAGMAAAWGDGKGVTTKAERMKLVARRIVDPETFHRAQWEPTERTILAILARTPTPTKGRVLGEARMRGDRGVDQAFGRLVTCGAVLANWTSWGSKLDVPDIVREERGPLVLAPGLAALPPLPLPPPPPLKLRGVPEAQVRATRPNRGGETASRLCLLTACAARRKLKVRKDGEPSEATWITLEKELGASLTEVAWLYELARAAGLLVLADGHLRAIELPANEASLGALLARVREGFVARGTWVDDLDPEDPVQTARRSPPRAAGAAVARPLLYGTLARVATEGWFRLDELVDALLDLDPVLGFRDERTDSHARELRVEGASEKLHQRQFLRGAVAQAMWRLGIVDVGTTGEWYTPLPPDSNYAYDRRFKGAYGYRRVEDAALPEWTPPPCDLVVRISPLGRRALGLTTEEPPVDAVAGFHVGMDFEVVAPIASTPATVLFQLDLAARAHPAGPGDPVRRWRLERERWLGALQGGLDGTALLAALAVAQGRPLPPNVTDTIAGWAEGYGVTTLWARHDLVELADRAARDAAAKAGGTAVGDRFLLVPRGAATGTVIDYGGAPARVLDVTPDGAVTLQPTPDLMVADELAAVTTGEGPDRRLDPAKLRGRPPEATVAWLRARSREVLPPATAIAVRGWCGGVPARLAQVELLQLRDADDAEALLGRPGIARHVAGVLVGGLLVLKPGARKALTKELAAIGVIPAEGLQLEGG